jgi:hypothetical protein
MSRQTRWRRGLVAAGGFFALARVALLRSVSGRATVSVYLKKIR